MAVFDWFSQRIFNAVHRNNLVYNTCWEDPRLDHVALELGPEDNVLVITSAGCNALDYALASPSHVYAVDMNPRQNALLELKQAAIRELDYETFFQMFGEGRLPGVADTYKQKLRSQLSPFAQKYWDRCIRFFDNRRRTFYFRGTSGAFARMVNLYADTVLRLRPQINQVLAAKSLEEQRELFFKNVRGKLWTRPMKFAMGRDTTLSLVGVPKAQRRQIETQYEGGVVKWVQDCVDAVFTEIPLTDNYFWRVYLTGSYTPEACPRYVSREGFEKLKGGLVDRVSTHTDSVQAFLEKHPGKISRYILLDHMDWLSDKYFPLLVSEWQAIVDRAAPATRILWRSGGLRTDFLEGVSVKIGGQPRKILDILRLNEALARELHAKDRVHTYGCFYIADLAA